MTTRAMTTRADETLFDRIAALLPVENRQEFYRRMAHLRSLGPNDEILQVAEAMGFLALIMRQTPAEIAAERTKIETLIQTATADLARFLDVNHIAAVLAESLRQQFEASGLGGNAQLLRSTATTFAKALDTFLDPARGALPRLSGALAMMQADLDNAASHIRALSRLLVKDIHRALAIVTVGALVVGFFLGVSYVQWTIHSQ
jgi:hypothetical protein